MSGPAESKIEIKGVKVYLHKKDPLTRSRILHIDIESPILNRIIKDGESTYCAGKHGGVFIGLRSEMIKRAEGLLKVNKERRRPQTPSGKRPPSSSKQVLEKES